jgi:GH25 family lysozyme M1 (1,4-beta-N-acetylmuramidase)
VFRGFFAKGGYMRKKYAMAYIAALSLLSGCGQKVGQISYSTDEVVEAAATDVIQTAPAETAPVETTAPTTAAATENIKSEPPEELSFELNNVIEVYDEVTVGDVFKAEAVELQNGDEIIDTSQLGESELNISYIYNDELYEYPIDYTVVDTTPPTVLNSGWNAYVQSGTVFDLNDYVGFADNYDSSPVLTYTGYVDTSVCGDYSVTASASDSSGNVSTWELTLTVVDEIPVPEDNNDRISFDSFMQQYAGENVEFGIDVSQWQGNIDFESVKNAGCSFVIIRMGHYYDDITMDNYYATNIAAAKAAGLKVGVYIYTTANTEDEIKENAQWIASQLGGQELDFPVVFDWEEFGNFQQYGMSIHDLNEYFELFSDELEQYGYSAMLYSSKNFLNNFWYEQDEHPVWLAHYTDSTDYEGNYDMWQASCYGRISGIDGDVDLDILYTE